MLTAKNVNFAFSLDANPCLVDISLEVAPGEMLAIVGENGSGKSTLAEVLAGILEPQSGTVSADGQDVRTHWNAVGLVRQDPQCQLVSEVVYDEVAYGLHNLGLEEGEIRARVRQALETCGMLQFLGERVSRLSGGEQQRLSLAAQIALRPRYLVLDEPTSMLDSSSRAELQELLLGLVREGLGIALVTHRADEVRLADRVVVLHEGRARVAQHEEALRLLAPETSQDAQRTRAARSWSPSRSLGIEHIRVIRNNVLALDDLSVRALPGHLTVVLGRAGSGKTTMALSAAGILQPESGTVRVCERPVQIGDVGLTLQRPEDQVFCDTVLEEVSFGPLNEGLDEDRANERAKEALVRVGLSSSLWDRSPWTLSGGELRRVALADMLATKPEAYVFDEPTVGLDLQGRVAIRKVACSLADEGNAVVVITHDEEEWLAVADDVVFLREGKVAYAGAVPEALGTTSGFELAGLVPPSHIERADGEQAADVAPQRTAEGSAFASSKRYVRKQRGWSEEPSVRRDVVRLVAYVALSVAVFFIDSLAVQLGFAGMVFVLLYVVGFGLKDIVGMLRALAVLLAFAWCANAIVVDGSGDVVSLGMLGISGEGVWRGIVVAMRIVLLAGLASAYVQTTTPSRLTKALLAPFSALGVKGKLVDSFALMLMLALRSVSYSIQLIRRIEAAQLLRGAKLRKGSLRVRLRAWTAVLVPALVELMRHGDDLALALQKRGFGNVSATMEDDS